MEETAFRSGRKSGWSDGETNLLWETADEAQKEGMPLKQVFERVAASTGRRPNSIRNFYYAQARQRLGEAGRAARFVPFEEDEVRRLMERVLRARAQGQSVRSCLQQISSGDHSLMLRYQNKYRSVLKARPELVREIVDELREEGVPCVTPEIGRRAGSLDAAYGALREAAAGDEETVRLCETLTRLMLENRNARSNPYRLALEKSREAQRSLCEAAQGLLGTLKSFLAEEEDLRASRLDEFCRLATESVGAVEGCLARAEREISEPAEIS